MASRTSTDPIEILLEMGVDLDNLSEEEDYLSALMEAVNTLTIKNASDPRIGFLAEEIRKVRQKRKAADPKFKARKTKISADSFKKGSVTGFNFKPKALSTSAIVPYQAPEAEEEGGEKKKRKPREKNLIAEIAKSVVKISDILKQQYNVKKKSAEFDRKKAEQEKRALQKSKLSKGFEALVKGTQKVIAPVQSLLSKVFGFLFNLLLGKFIMKLLDWIGNPKNREKFNNVVRFLKDNWPKLIALYLVFGNSIGRFILGLTKTLIGGAVKLTVAIAKLLAAKKLVGGLRARRLARFLGKRGGMIGAGLATAATVGGAMALTDAVTGGGEEQTQGYSGGGIVSLFDKFGKRKKDSESVDGGRVDGPSGIDKVPAMLTAGEFVMSRGAVQKIGIGKLEAMNAAGGGTNNPKVVDNTVYASVGGYVGDADLGKKGTPDPEKESSGGASPSSNFGYRLGQVNPMVDLSVMEKVAEKVVDKERRRGQGGRLIGRTTQRAGEGTKVYKNGQLVTSYDKYGRKKEYGKPEGFMRALAGVGDLLTGNLFDFDRRNEKNVGISEKRIVTKEFKGGRDFTDDTTTTRLMTAIARSDLIKHQDQILKQLPKGNTIENVISGDIFRGVGQGGKELGSTTRRGGSNITPEKLARILATSDAQKATRREQDRARRLDLAIRGIGEKDGVSMMAGDMTPALQQAEATANKRHAELMKSTNPEKIAAYDKKHGEGAYSQKLKEKLYRIYGNQSTGQTQPQSIKPTGKVVGRENLSPQAQKALARLDAQKAGTLPPDVKTSGPLLGRMAMGMMGGLNNMMSGLTGGITGAINNPKSFVESMGGTVVDSNSQEQNMKRVMALSPEMRNAVLADMERSQAPQAKLSSNQPQPKISAPQPPTPPSNNVQVVKSGGSKGGGESQQTANGSDLPVMNAGNGSKSKFTLLGISF